jgi:hypothetical protein
VALYPDVASHTVNQFDGRNLLWRSVIRYGTSKIWCWPLLTTLARKVQMLTSTPSRATPFVDIRERLTLAQAIVDTVRDPRSSNDQMTDGSHLWPLLASVR